MIPHFMKKNNFVEFLKYSMKNDRVYKTRYS